MLAKLKKDAPNPTLIVEYGTKRYEFDKKKPTETSTGVFGMYQEILEEIPETTNETPVTQEEPQGV